MKTTILSENFQFAKVQHQSAAEVEIVVKCLSKTVAIFGESQPKVCIKKATFAAPN